MMSSFNDVEASLTKNRVAVQGKIDKVCTRLDSLYRNIIKSPTLHVLFKAPNAIAMHFGMAKMQ